MAAAAERVAFITSANRLISPSLSPVRTDCISRPYRNSIAIIAAVKLAVYNVNNSSRELPNCIRPSALSLVVIVRFGTIGLFVFRPDTSLAAAAAAATDWHF
jgi:hypothetical protein